jgi:deferrochelatase/peroxidase EfeB
VEACTDIFGCLPTAQAESPQPFPSFAESPLGLAFHDFGRNGSFLVLRQLKQEVRLFEKYTENAAGALEKDYPGLPEVVGAPIDSAWVAAKLLGRWQDGSSLVDHPHAPLSARRPAKGKPPKGKLSKGEPGEDNTFAFGVDDPQGLRCPMGAHIRRANPRDSFKPGDAENRKIVNSHRLLRRGRTYGDARGERGCSSPAFAPTSSASSNSCSRPGSTLRPSAAWMTRPIHCWALRSAATRSPPRRARSDSKTCRAS